MHGVQRSFRESVPGMAPVPKGCGIAYFPDDSPTVRTGERAAPAQFVQLSGRGNSSESDLCFDLYGPRVVDSHGNSSDGPVKRTDQTVVQVKDLVGQRRGYVKQDRDQRRVTPIGLIFFEVVDGRLSAFPRQA
ncbi:hypothetical protein OKW43_007766 [Paraburkholderia sp. WC7.3g]